ncbi:MAG TPA: AI-2E family transporter [Caulobacteraceae bacterium]|jgi:predicted PurR-regulated permease PerM
MTKPDPAGALGLDAAFVKRALFVLALIAVAFLLYRLIDVFLLVFGAVVVAVLLRAIADPLRRRTHIPNVPAVLIALLTVAAALALAGWLFGRQLDVQIANLTETLPRAWARVQEQLRATPVGSRLLDDAQQASGQAAKALAAAPRIAAGVAGALTNLLLVIVAGIMLAIQPRAYRDGLLMLFPRGLRPRLKEALDASGVALHRWLLGTLVSMTVIGVLTGIGLAVVGVPSPLALGLFAGLAQFVPIVGPIVSAIPGLVIAASGGPQMLLWTFLVYFGVQQIESNLVTPFVQRRMVSIPLAVSLFSVVAFGMLLGALGVLLATPLAVTAFVLIKVLYVRDVLGEEVDVPGAGAQGKDERRPEAV